jgi:nicotinamide mononucleotide (NMN) deamidase PncC
VHSVPVLSDRLKRLDERVLGKPTAPSTSTAKAYAMQFAALAVVGAAVAIVGIAGALDEGPDKIGAAIVGSICSGYLAVGAFRYARRGDR